MIGPQHAVHPQRAERHQRVRDQHAQLGWGDAHRFHRVHHAHHGGDDTERGQAVAHSLILTAALLSLPLAVRVDWLVGRPVLSLLIGLTIAVGAPTLLVSSSSPLLQRWFSHTAHRWSADPYFLYAASNLGSMLALMSAGGVYIVSGWRRTIFDAIAAWTSARSKTPASAASWAWRTTWSQRSPSSAASSASMPAERSLAASSGTATPKRPTPGTSKTRNSSPAP